MSQQKIPIQRQRNQNRSFKESKVLCSIKQNCQLQFSSLSTLTNISINSYKHQQVQKILTLQNIKEYIEQALDNVYGQDCLGIKQRIKLLLISKLPTIKPKVLERINLMKYLINSLQYKTFAEINLQIQKEWRKNILFYSITTIWACCMKIQPFQKPQDFAKQYIKFRNFLANVTYYYFKQCLKILNSKNVSTFNFILNESTHEIINNLKDWPQLYNNVFLKLFVGKNKERKAEDFKDYDLDSLQINRDYLNVSSQVNQLIKTTQSVESFDRQIQMVEKMNILKTIRANFLAEIYKNSKNIAENRKSTKISHLQKDDIIGCMIFCIVKANLINVATHMKAFNLLLGPNINEILSKKGVDSYFADLQCAVEYLHSSPSTQNTLTQNILAQNKPRIIMTSIQNDL